MNSDVAVQSPRIHHRSIDRRVAVTLWCAGLAAFSAMYAPQGLLTDISRDAGVDASQASLLVSAATLGLALSVLPWAWLADRFGTSGPLRIAATAAALCAVLVPWLPSFEALIAGRFVQGVALGGIPALAMALPHQLASPRQAATLGGSYVAATSLGGLGGRILVVPLAGDLGWRAALFLLGVAVAVLMLALVVMVPSASPSANRPEPGLRNPHLRDPAMLRLFGIGALLVGGMVTVFNFLPFRLEAAPYLLTPALVSLIFLAYLAGTVGSRAAGTLTARVGHRPVLVAACLLVSAGAMITLARPLIVILIGTVILTAGMFVGHAVASSMVAAQAKTARNQATALYNISYYAGSSCFGFVGGIAWVQGQWLMVAVLVAVLGAVGCVLAGSQRAETTTSAKSATTASAGGSAMWAPSTERRPRSR